MWNHLITVSIVRSIQYDCCFVKYGHLNSYIDGEAVCGLGLGYFVLIAWSGFSQFVNFNPLSAYSVFSVLKM